MRATRLLGPLPVVVWRWNEDVPGAAARARVALHAALDQLGYDAEVIGDAVVCVSEFVANAVEHAAGPYEMRLHATGGVVVCEVDDRDPRIPRVARIVSGPLPLYEAEERHRGGGLEALASVLSERGRGLLMVHALTNGAWGFRASGGTKTAWLAIPAGPA